MITKTIGLGPEYTDLYKAIETASNGAIVVKNLEEFFMNITRIAALENGKFLRLPLDEPMFVIDADTRKISIPSDFSANGLSVQGDHLAETIFFKIDRYYDFVDLNTKDIYINWKMGDQSGKSKNFIKSVDIEAGYIIFGWPVAKELTAKSGNLSFAVQICSENANGELTYNFNTLVSTIPIKDGLVLISPVEVDATADILNMLVDSKYSKDEIPVADITWISGNGKGLVANGPKAEFKDEVNMPTTVVAGTPSDTPVKLYALASAGGDVVVYHYEQGVTGAMEGVEVGADDAKIDGVIYYTDAEGTALASAAEIEDWFAKKADAKKLYLRYCVLTADEAKAYGIKANGAKYDSKSQVIGVGDTKEGAIVTVPSAKAPIAKMSIKTQAELEDGYTVEEGVNAVYLNPETGAVLTAEFELSDGMTSDDKGVWEYIWTKKIGSSKEFVAANAPAFATAASDDLTITDEGEYKVKIAHYKNKTTVESAEAEAITASYLASPIDTITLSSSGKEIGDNLSFNSAGSMSKRSVKVSALATINGSYGKDANIKYVWEKTPEINLEEGEEIVWESVGEKADLTISAEGYYRVKAINVYNGSAYTGVSKSFYVFDTATGA